MTREAFLAWRKRMNYNQRQAAEALGCSLRSISNWESGASIPKYIALACSAVAMGWPPMG